MTPCQLRSFGTFSVMPRYSLRSTVTRSLASSRALFRERLCTLLALPGPCGRWRAIALANPTSWADILVEIMSPGLLHLHLGRSASLPPNVVTTDLHPVTRSIIRNKAYRFRRFIIDGTKLSLIWRDARSQEPRVRRWGRRRASLGEYRDSSFLGTRRKPFLPAQNLPWINFLDRARNVTVLLNAHVISVETRNRHGGVITIGVKDIPTGTYGLDDVIPPRYSPLLVINTFANSLLSSRSFLFRSSSPKRREVLSFIRLWKVLPTLNGVACCNTSKSWNLSLWPSICPAPRAGGYPFVVELRECPRSKWASIVTDISADEVHDEQPRGITKFMEARYDAGFILSSLDVDVSVAALISGQAPADYTKTWDPLVVEAAFFVRF